MWLANRFRSSANHFWMPVSPLGLSVQCGHDVNCKSLSVILNSFSVPPPQNKSVNASGGRRIFRVANHNAATPLPQAFAAHFICAATFCVLRIDC